MKRALFLAVLAVSALSVAQDPHAGETKAGRDARMRWWREARFGMFIHWGLYAEPAGTWRGTATNGAGEWIMHDLKIPVADYATVAPRYNPIRFDADAWVAVAKAAGMRYIVMTAKHHEGFAMFASADPYNVVTGTPFGRDPIAEMAAACRRAGLKFGVYYSQAQDWHHAGGAAYGGHWDSAQDGDLHEYVRTVAAPQLRELMKYQPAILWWDTPVAMSKTDVAALTAALPKSIIMNNRLGNGVPGDTETPEQTIPATGFPGRDWETCMTINDTWGYKAQDTDFKSSATLLRNLIDIASKGGNYLLNVGPDSLGVIPSPEVGRLADIGRWLRINGRSVYGTTVSPYKRLPFDGRITVKGNSLFVNVFSWPADGLTLPGLATRVKEVRNVATGLKLSFTQVNGALKIMGQMDDAVSTALEVRLAGKPVVNVPESTLDLGAAGRTLVADDAETTGGLQIEHSPSNVGYWIDQSGTVSWTVTAKEPFSGLLTMSYACDAGAGGSVVSVQLDGKDTGVQGTVEETGSWSTYRSASLGEIKIPAGRHVLRIVAKSMPHGAVMNLRSVELGGSQP